MIIVADSGSTKTDWRILDQGKEVLQVGTEGVNPYYMTAQKINELVEQAFRKHKDLNIEHVYFYGSGCSSENNKRVIQDALDLVYPTAVISIEHDLTAAARSLCGSQSGIACILGTGSNSARYDGEIISENIASLGYILGDEGSGNHLGRTLIQAYFRNRLSDDIKAKFDEEFGFTISKILEETYQGEIPVRFFSGFSKFIGENIEDQSLYDLVYASFTYFLRENVMQYAGYKSEIVHFTGSVAYFYKAILIKCCEDNDVRVGEIVKEPIDGLLSFHEKQV